MKETLLKEKFEEKIKSKEIVAKAYKFAEKAHAGQTRKTGEDYITHCIAVANILVSYGADDETIVAALLHDVVEDTNMSVEDIKKKFGDRIAFLVDGVTKPQEDSVEKTFEKIKRYSLQDRRVLLIKLADRIHNIQTKIDSAEWKNKYYNSTKNFLIPLAREFNFNEMADRIEKLLLTLKQNGI